MVVWPSTDHDGSDHKEMVDKSGVKDRSQRRAYYNLSLQHHVFLATENIEASEKTESAFRELR